MKKIGYIFTLLLLFNSIIFADAMDDLKTAVAAKDTSKIQFVLDSADSTKAKDYEKYILDQAKNFVANDDLDYASSLAEMVLMFDMDNSDAQKLYTSIQKAKKAKAEALARQEEQERKKKEEERKKAEAEEQKRQLEEFQAQKKKEEQEQKEYIESLSKVGFRNFPMGAGITIPLDFAKSSFADEYNNNSKLYTRMGFGVAGNIGFKHPYFDAMIYLNYNFLPISFINNAGMKSDFKTRITFGLPMFSEWFRLSVGYNSYTIMGESHSALYEVLSAPTIGIGIDRLKIGDSVMIGAFTDLNLITFDKYSEINYAFDAELTIRYYLPVDFMAAGRLYVENNTSFNTLIISKQNEWTLKTMFSVGVAFND